MKLSVRKLAELVDYALFAGIATVTEHVEALYAIRRFKIEFVVTEELIEDLDWLRKEAGLSVEKGE